MFPALTHSTLIFLTAGFNQQQIIPLAPTHPTPPPEVQHIQGVKT